MDSNVLTITGVIATILSLIFAAGAVWNSHIRRKHLAQLERSQTEEPRIKFKPMPTEAPTIQNRAQEMRQESNGASLFRQIRPSGHVEADDPEEEDDLYVWE